MWLDVYNNSLKVLTYIADSKKINLDTFINTVKYLIKNNNKKNKFIILDLDVINEIKKYNDLFYHVVLLENNFRRYVDEYNHRRNYKHYKNHQDSQDDNN